MKRYDWDREKNETLKKERGISFEEIVFHIENGDELDVYPHPNQERYQKIYWRITMVDYHLDQEEQEILDAFDKGKIDPIPNAKAEMEKHRQYAAETFKNDQTINIRMASRDLSTIQKMALSEGIPYQTFIVSILHKYADGKFVEKESIR